MGATAAKLIKIGWTGGHPDERLAVYRAASPIPVVPLATTPGGLADEHEFHRQFQEDRDHHEWFRESPGLLAVIEAADPWSADPRPTRRLAADPTVGVGEWALATYITVRGVTRSAAQWADLTGLTLLMVKFRLRSTGGDQRLVDRMFQHEGPRVTYLWGKDRSSPWAKAESARLSRWYDSFSEEEWERYNGPRVHPRRPRFVADDEAIASTG